MKANANGIEFYYERHGKGPPLILICGFTNNLTMWKDFLSPLSQKFEVILFDNRGAGRTTVTKPPYTIDQLADDTIALMDTLEISKSYMVGFSMGSAIIQSVGLRYPERILKGVMLAPFHTLPSTARMQAETTAKLFQEGIDPHAILETVLPWIYSNEYLSDPKRIEETIHEHVNTPYPQPPEGYLGQLEAVISFDLTNRLKEISTELLMIAGEEDLYTPLYTVDVLAKKLSTAKLITLPEMGHMIHIEEKNKVLEEICAFCKNK